jgi:molecular chaperone IbpA
LDENKWQVEVALAGYDKKDIQVRVIEGTLVVSTVNKDTKVDDSELVHRGISKRQFTRTWSMADDSVVQRAKMEDGMLYVEIERIVPEEKKPKIIEIK